MLFPMAQSDCPICGGTGWKIVERPSPSDEKRAQRFAAPGTKPGGATGEPKLVWGVPCDCGIADRATRVLNHARVPGRYEHCDFDNFETDVYDADPNAAAWNRSLEQARLIVEGFTRDFPLASDTGLLLVGPCGTGKTHLAVAALKQLVLRGHDGLFYDYRELLKEIQASYNAESPSSEMSVLEPVLKTEVLLLDDLGASKPSAWALDIVGHILNVRYNEKRVTLLTTNYLDSPGPAEASSAPASAREKKADGGRLSRLPSGQGAEVHDDTLADRVGQRIRSRLYEMCRTVELYAPDYRREVRQAGHVASPRAQAR
jgi:DNA replication protein DnaC